MAWIRGACIIQVAQQSRLSSRAAAIEAANAIDTCGTIETCRLYAIINVLATVASRPAVHTDATVRTMRVRACRTILTDGRTQCTLIDIHITVASRKIRRAIASIIINTVNTGAAILTQISGTIVDIQITVLAVETYK